MKNIPNIIIVTLHDLGKHISVYDSALPYMPNLEKMAKEGVVFDNHFTTTPLCSPARASIQTGRYPHSNGMNGLCHDCFDFSLNDNEKCIAQYMNELGYHTALYGHQHEVKADVSRLGYKENPTDPYFHSGCFETLDMLDGFFERNARTLFFLSIGMWEAHRSFKKSHKYTPVDMGKVKVPPYLLDCPEVREDLADFYGVVLNADAGMGILFNMLEHYGISDNTMVIFTTDHGAAFPRAKSTLYDGGIGVSFVVRWPDGIKGGKRVKSLTSHIDILPTLLELSGMDIPEQIHGKSLCPLFADSKAVVHKMIFGEKSWHGDEYDPIRCVRNDQWKFIINFQDGYLYQNPVDIKMGLSGQVMEPRRRTSRPKQELYNIMKDPDELCNLVDVAEFASVKKNLYNELMQWMAKTQDPLLNGHIEWKGDDSVKYLNNMDAPMPPSDSLERRSHFAN